MVDRAALACIVVATMAVGCVTPPVDRYFYTPPEKPENVRNEVTVAENFSLVWDSLIGELSKSFFVINNVEKASRIINLSFTSSDPEQYTNCGSSRRQHSFMEKTYNYEYEVSEDSRYKAGGVDTLNSQIIWIYDVQRKTSLSGRINVYVAPRKEGTKVSVNTRYIVNLSTSMLASGVNLYGNKVGTQRVDSAGSSEISFNTNTKGTLEADDGTIVNCYANGVLEASILDLVR